MSYRTLAFGALAAVLLGSAVPPLSANAADLDYGLGDTPPPVAETKVEFGTGWYVRGDIAGTTTHYADELYQPYNANYSLVGISKTHQVGYDLSLGGGYSFLNRFRADANFDFHQFSKVTDYASYCVNGTTQSCTALGHLFTYDVLVNGFYDIGRWGPATPYVGAGVGLAFGNYSNRIFGGPNGTYASGLGAYSFAFALMAGVAFDIYDHTKIDVGYRYLNNGTLFGQKVDFQEGRIGVRYMID